MYKYKSKTVKLPEHVSTICDVCKKNYDVCDKDFEEQEIIKIDTYVGYGSIFGDEDRIQLDICQHCFKKLLGKYIKINGETE